MSKTILTVAFAMALTPIVANATTFTSSSIVAVNDSPSSLSQTNDRTDSTWRSEEDRSRSNTTTPDRDVRSESSRLSNRAYPAPDANCRYVDGRRVCDGKRLDNENNSATKGGPFDESQNLSR